MASSCLPCANPGLWGDRTRRQIPGTPTSSRCPASFNCGSPAAGGQTASLPATHGWAGGEREGPRPGPADLDRGADAGDQARTVAQCPPNALIDHPIDQRLKRGPAPPRSSGHPPHLSSLTPRWQQPLLGRPLLQARRRKAGKPSVALVDELVIDGFAGPAKDGAKAIEKCQVGTRA